MASLLRELYDHQHWADAEHWRAIEAHLPAAGDQALRTRLHHINLVQRAFRWMVGDRQSPFAMTKAEDYATLADLKAATREYHEEVARFLDALTPDRLEETIEVPWFKEPSLSLTRERALTQCAMHSHWHRGQNAVRLRELGAEPPAVDLIVWYWKGRPPPAWTA